MEGTDICVLMLQLCKWPPDSCWNTFLCGLLKYQVQRCVKSFLSGKEKESSGIRCRDRFSLLAKHSLAGCWLGCSAVCAADPLLCRSTGIIAPMNRRRGRKEDFPFHENCCCEKKESSGKNMMMLVKQFESLCRKSWDFQKLVASTVCHLLEISTWANQ